jgi:hypothetical protein
MGTKRGFFYTTTHLNIGHYWTKISCQVHYDGFGEPGIFSGFVTARLLLVSEIKMCLPPPRMSLQKRGEQTGVPKNGFHEYFQNLYESWQKFVIVQRTKLKETFCKYM